jgi:YD repeat-containing protein
MFYSNSDDMDVKGIRYTRNFTNTEWQSLYVPFEIPVTDELLEDFEIADLNDIRQYDRDDDGVKDETVVEAFKVKSGATLAANYPYLIRAKEAGEKTITVTDATLFAAKKVSINCSSIREKFTFTGTYSRMESSKLTGCYALSKGEWQPLAADATLGAFRVYLKIESRDNNVASARAIRIHVVGDTTDIDELESSANGQQATVVYDLQGRRIVDTDNLKGVYIINGKKVVK